MKNFSILTLILIFFSACQPNSKTFQYNDEVIDTPEYANNFLISYGTDYCKLTVNFSSNTDSKSYNYFLVDLNNKMPDLISSADTIRTPIEKAVFLSSTYLGYIELLDLRNSIVGISGLNFIYDSIVNKMIDNEQIVDVGFEQNLDIEKILELAPDVVFAYDINGSLQAKYEALQRLGIQVVLVTEYLEEHPLGRAEWLKFFAAFYGLDDEANKLFDSISVKYNRIQLDANDVLTQTGVILNTPFQGVWYLPAKNSYMAKLISDAGGNYVFKEKSQTQTFSISLEEVILFNDSIDILLNPGFVNSYSDIISIDKRIENLTCVKNLNVFNNNKRVGDNGGNDFYEKGVVEPHLILSDLITIFSSDTLNYANMIYYQKIEE